MRRTFWTSIHTNKNAGERKQKGGWETIRLFGYPGFLLPSVNTLVVEVFLLRYVVAYVILGLIDTIFLQLVCALSRREGMKKNMIKKYEQELEQFQQYNFPEFVWTDLNAYYVKKKKRTVILDDGYSWKGD